MKKIWYAVPVLLLSLAACKKTTEVQHSGTGTDTVAVQKPEFKESDSVIFQDSVQLDKNLTALFESTVPTFDGTTDKSLLDSLYKPANLQLNGYSRSELEAGLKASAQQYYDDIKKNLADFKPTFHQTWNQSSHMKTFSREHDFLTIQYKFDGYSGGAHGYYNEIYKVFDLKNNKTLQLSDVVENQDSQVWSRILMDHFLKNDIGTGQSEMLLVKEIPLNNNFYFDNQNLYFLYNQYEIAAYAAGPILIKVPFSDIKPMLTQSFRERLSL